MTLTPEDVHKTLSEVVVRHAICVTYKSQNITIYSSARVAEWFSALCLLHEAQTIIGSSHEPPLMLMDMSTSM